MVFRVVKGHCGSLRVTAGHCEVTARSLGSVTSVDCKSLLCYPMNSPLSAKQTYCTWLHADKYTETHHYLKLVSWNENTQLYNLYISHIINYN